MSTVSELAEVVEQQAINIQAIAEKYEAALDEVAHLNKYVATAYLLLAGGEPDLALKALEEIAPDPECSAV